MDELQRFGQLIRSAREAQGMNADVLAGKLGLGTSTMSNIETGKRKSIPDPELINGIHQVLGLPKEEMLQTLGYLDPAYEQPNTVAIKLDSELADLVRLLKRSSPEAVVTVRNIVCLMNGEPLEQRRYGVLPPEGNEVSETYRLG